MGLRARILAVTGGSGPRSKNVLMGLARGEKQRAAAEDVFDAMLDKGEIVRFSDKRQAKYGPPRMRGDIELIMVALIVGMMSTAAAYFVGHWRGDDAGAERVQAQWDKKKLEDVRFTRERDAERDKVVLEEQRKRVAAEQRAGDLETKLGEAKREARRNGVPLVACPQPGPDRGPVSPGGAVAGESAAPGAGGNGVDPARAALPGRALFTWEFVREFDGGWSGLDGQPLSRLAAGGDAAERAGASSPYGAEDVVDVAEVNANRCSADRRKLAGLIARIERASAVYDKERR